MESDRQFQRVLTFSRGIARIPYLAEFLGARQVTHAAFPRRTYNADCVVGWGRKLHTHLARQYAERHGLPYVSLEDGFLRSIGLGVKGEPALSLIVDDLGIYYDATVPSRLETLLNAPAGAGDRLCDPALLTRAKRSIERLIDARLSKYNDAPAAVSTIGSTGRGKVLVVDQAAGDLSVRYGMGNSQAFTTMLEAALDEHPTAEMLVKTHPDVIAGKKAGYLTGVPQTKRVRLIVEATNPITLIEQVDHVYVVTSLLGFEALMLGKPVTCFGVPFYAGWGLTDDRVRIDRRRRRRTLEAIFAAAYLHYARYIDPDTGKRAEIEQVIAHLEAQRRYFAINRGRCYCFGFSLWKRNYVRAFLRSPGTPPVFVGNTQKARRRGFDSQARIVVWGTHESPDIAELARQYRVPIWRVEDGFLRSVGLGSDLTAPVSLVVDTRGMYFDPRTPSDLEVILQTSRFSVEEIERARRLRRAILAMGLSKYNVGNPQAIKIHAGCGQRVILVPGQVPDDASVQLGCQDIRSDKVLLQAVRKRYPDAYVLYKPHPDVVSGNRRGAGQSAACRALYDQTIATQDIATCLAVADEVHTMTSLVGFEALLRELRVVTYGLPFYAGWGLTEDRLRLPRRRRVLTLDELVAGTLIRYPRYLNRKTGAFTSPEAAVAELAQERLRTQGTGGARCRWPIRQIRKLVHLWKGLAYAG